MAEHDLVINGSGSSSGGIYKNVKIRGEGTVTDDLECLSFKTYGTSDIKGHVKADRFDVFGQSTTHGRMVTTSSKVFGTMEVNGFICQNLKVRGTLEVLEGLKGESGDIKGTLTVKKDAEFERLTVAGGIHVNGMLNAGDIDINLKIGESRVDDIGGEKVVIRRKTSLIPFTKNEGHLVTDIIEGDEIVLEYTTAKVVRGKKVLIGEGCHIDLVEYTEEYKKTGKAAVGEAKQR